MTKSRNDELIQVHQTGSGDGSGTTHAVRTNLGTGDCMHVPMNLRCTATRRLLKDPWLGAAASQCWLNGQVEFSLSPSHQTLAAPLCPFLSHT